MKIILTIILIIYGIHLINTASNSSAGSIDFHMFCRDPKIRKDINECKDKCKQLNLSFSTLWNTIVCEVCLIKLIIIVSCIFYILN